MSDLEPSRIPLHVKLRRISKLLPLLGTGVPIVLHRPASLLSPMDTLSCLSHSQFSLLADAMIWLPPPNLVSLCPPLALLQATSVELSLGCMLSPLLHICCAGLYSNPLAPSHHTARQGYCTSIHLWRGVVLASLSTWPHHHVLDIF